MSDHRVVVIDRVMLGQQVYIDRPDRGLEFSRWELKVDGEPQELLTMSFSRSGGVCVRTPQGTYQTDDYVAPTLSAQDAAAVLAELATIVMNARPTH